jgi:hypothetical protein
MMIGYFIESGVHRAIAARENGLMEISAWLHQDGFHSVETLIPLAMLFSPRKTVSRVITKRRNLPGLIQAMANESTRNKVPIIHVQPLGVFAQPRSIPLRDVMINDDPSEEIV